MRRPAPLLLACLLLRASGSAAPGKPAKSVDWTKTPAASVPADGGGLELDETARAWLAGLPSDEDRRRAAKALSLGGVPYSWLSKADGLFRVEGCGLFEGPLDQALPVVREAESYGYWAFEKINEKLKGGGRYFVEFDPLTHLAGRSMFLIRYRLTKFFDGPRGLRLAYQFREGPVPAMEVRLPEPTKLVKRLSGEMRLYRLPGDRSFILYFTGEAEAHWAFYYLVPMAIIEESSGERVLRVFENAGRRAKTPLRKA